MKKIFLLIAIILTISACDSGNDEKISLVSNVNLDKEINKSISESKENLTTNTSIPVLNKQYEVIDEPISYSKPTLTEFLWLGCGACYNAEPVVKGWIKNLPHIDLVVHPVPGSPRWTSDARVFHTMNELKVDKKMVFDFYHEKKIPPSSSEIKSFFVSKGIVGDDYDNILKGFKVESLVKNSENLSKRVGAFSTPTFLVNGKYKIISDGHNTWSEIQDTINYLSMK
jgi:thiol:disulfide interchange protein DsbA